MNLANTKLKRILIITAGSIFALGAIVILFISPITKYLIEKYDEQYTGRKMELDWAYVNPFTGYLYLSDLKVYEFQSDSIFFSTSGLGMNVSLLKMLSKTYEISELTLTRPRSIIIQNKSAFNFDDLIRKFTPEEKDTTKAPVHFNILNIVIDNGEFHYREKAIGVNYYIKQVEFESPGMRWDVDTVAASFSLLSGPASGDAHGNFGLNMKNLDYRFAVVARKFDLGILEQYIKDMSSYGSLRANLDADMQGTGNLKDKEDVNSRGVIAVNDFHFGKDPTEDYMSFDKFAISIKELSPKGHIYSYDSVSLQHPYFKYERYDHLDNLQNMFGKNGSNIYAVAADEQKFNLVIEIARYVRILAKNFFKSDYQINRVAVYNADLKFNDYALVEKFSAELDPLNVLADSIDKKRARVGVSFKSGIKPFGNVLINISINPKDSSDFEMQYHLEKMAASMFNPYIISNTSFSLDRGSIEFKGNWNVKNGAIQSTNHLLLIDPRTTRRIRNKDTKWVPMPLIMSFVRERGNVIDYEIPITGNLKDPKFHLHDVITDLLQNIFVKPPTTPYRLRVENVETRIEKLLSLNWAMRQCELRPNQEKFVERMADFLNDNPQASLDVYPKEYTEKEKEHILFFEAKKKYYLKVLHVGRTSLDREDSIRVDRMSAKDSSFVRYLNKQVGDSMLFTIQAKCSKLVDADVLKAALRKVETEREKCFLAFFKEGKVEGRVKMHSSESTVPSSGYSCYKIDYKGALPESLRDAYQKMSELDDEAPRVKYKKERKRNKTLPD